MPPILKFSKDKILDVAYELVRKDGFDALNARRLAQSLGCSVQPIFHNFKNMDELSKNVLERICSKYSEYISSGKNKDKAYKEMGLSYIRFAEEEPEFFKLLFMRETNFLANDFMMSHAMANEIIESGRKLTHFDYETQKKFHLKVWIFTHGIACLVAMKTVRFTHEELSDLLESTVQEMYVGFAKKGN